MFFATENRWRFDHQRRPYTGPDEAEIRSIASTIDEESIDLSSNFHEGMDVRLNPNERMDARLDPNSDQFDAKVWASAIYKLFHNDPERYPDKSLGITFENLVAYGSAASTNYQMTVSNMPIAAIHKGWSAIKEAIKPSEAGNRVDILKKMDGIVKPGELLMVLGRPGAGCSTFLRTMASQTYGFHITRDSKIDYDGIKPSEIASTYRGDVVYCAENEINLPNLTVGQTLLFASRVKTPANRVPGVSRKKFARYMRDIVMALYGLSHTVNTKVGNELIHGVSGGERKRVSIAELALAGSSIQCWDNSTRGLDAATATEFISTLRLNAQTFRTASLVAIYQASEEIYDMFDRVVVLYEGWQIYYGPKDAARQFFMDMGWEPKPRQSTPDFVTSLTQPSERQAYAGMEKKVPRTPEEFNKRWRESSLYQSLVAEINEHNSNSMHEDSANAAKNEQFREAYRKRQSHQLPPKAAYTVSWWEQTKALTIRGFQRIQGDPQMPLTNIFGNMAIAFIISSMFYNLEPTTSSFYYRGALIFFSLLFNAFSAMLEVFSLFEARELVQKHHQYAFYHPAIDAFASILTQLPIKILNAIIFNTIIYFISNLRREPGNFFFFLLMNFTATLMMSHFFRTIGAFTNTISEAMIPANIVLLAMVLFTGFVIPKPILAHMWTAGGPWVDPLAYAFEALMTNEFHNREYPCPETSFVPYPPGKAPDNAFICGIGGAKPGRTSVLGDNYLLNTYDYKFSHQWRNYGVLCGFMFFFLGTYMLMVYVNPGARTKGEVLVFPHRVLRKMRARGATKQHYQQSKDAEAATITYQNSAVDEVVKHESLPDAKDLEARQVEQARQLIEASDEVFYWKDVCYDVKIKSETRRLLNYVDGWVKPGTLTALMGASGAGKTTLLDTLANRVTMGVVTGQMFVNGIPRDDSFQRTTGYAMQQDLHLETSTVREALQFSALLRQPNSVPRKEKLAYVDNVLKILEMDAYADAVVGRPGKGLNVEQRKRLTIGVEMAAKPKLLLFLDEPTSGLDSQTAWSVCALMKKLSNAGQAILCTIHQPSALLLQQFDRMLFLARGGRTVYFGEIGENSKTLTGYFEKYGADPCPPDANPAEWMLSVIGAAPGSHAKYDYADVWLHSQERQAVRLEIDRLIGIFNAKDSNVSPKTSDSGEFAAPFWEQYLLNVWRFNQMLWRDPMYIWSKIGLNIVGAIFNGFVFFKADTSLQGMQDLMFSVFMFTVAIVPIVNSFVSVFSAQRNLYEARERPSKMFSWKAFIAATITAEFPWQCIVGVFAFVSWYYPAGLYNNARNAGQMTERGGMTLFYCLAFYQFAISMGFMLGAPIKDPDTAANVSILLFAVSLMFCGVLKTKNDMPGFWVFMYRVSPMTYWIQGMLTLAVANTPVDCAEYEWQRLSPPNGLTCGQYFSLMFEANSIMTGYLKNPDATDTCQYCKLKTTNQYLLSIDTGYHLRWRNFGIFMAYIAINYGACVVLYWIARVPKSKTRVHKVDLGGRDVPLEESTSDSSQWPPALVESQGKPPNCDNSRLSSTDDDKFYEK